MRLRLSENVMLKIWGRNNSSNVQKVLWLCHELGLPHKRIDAGGQFGVVSDPAYKRMNPNSRVPTLQEDDFILWESNAIVRYLAAKHSPGGLWPGDLRVRADADRWMDWTSVMFLPVFTPLFWGLVRTPPEKRDSVAMAKAAAACGESLKVLEQGLEDKDYVAGDRFTMGDIPIGVNLYRWFAFKEIERPTLPRVQAYYERLAQRPAYRETVMIPLS
jgi:glutathione S-transferase